MLCFIYQNNDNTSVTNVVPDPTWSVEPVLTCIDPIFVNAILPDAASDSINNDDPVDTVKFLGVLNT